MAIAAQQDEAPNAGTESADALVEQAKGALQAGQLATASGLCDTALSQTPEHQEALYTKAVCQRYAKDYQGSLATLATLIDLHPEYGRAYQERGHNLRDQGDTAGALTAYLRAVAHNSALLASWRMIAALQQKTGRAEEAQFAQAQVIYFESLPPELQSVASLIQERKLLKAERLCRSFLQTHGHHTEAMRLLADIGMKFNSYEEAEFLLESCLVLEPKNTNAHYDYVNVLSKRQKFDKALTEVEQLRAKQPDSPQVEILYANQNLAVGNFDTALGIFRAHIARRPNNPSIHLALGHALKTIGQQPDAIAAYRDAYAVKPDFGDAFWSLANLKTYRFLDEEVAQMREAEAAPRTALEDRYHLCFALAKALEDRGDYATSFEYYERGNRLKREEVRYDWRRISGEIQLQIEHCTPALFDAQRGSGNPAPDPIFIVGLPRAGSTLLEQILASHSQVEGTMELPNILSLAHRLDGRRRVDEEARYPGNLGELSADELRAFGEAFIKDTQIHRKTGTPFFIDKMPNNFRHIGLIHLILPNAKIIDARRSAMGCCFSGFKQLFAEGQEFTYGLEEIGHYYSDYVHLMDHWDAVLPDQVLRVRYEDVVTDLEGQVRRLLDHCGLPFEEACIRFHENDRAVRTASSEQVRQPIFTSGMDQWENFSPFLDPLRAVLGADLVSK